VQVMTPDPVSVSPDLPISRFIDDYLYRHHHREFPVAHDGVLLGRIGTKQVAALDRHVWPQTEVSAVMLARTEDDTIAPDAAALDAIARMSGSGHSHLFVVRDGLLVGVISRRDLMELLSVKLELVDDRDSRIVPRQSHPRRSAPS